MSAPWLKPLAARPRTPPIYTVIIIVEGTVVQWCVLGLCRVVLPFFGGGKKEGGEKNSTRKEAQHTPLDHRAFTDVFRAAGACKDAVH